MSANKKPADVSQILEENRQAQVDEYVGKVDRAMEAIKSEIEKFGKYPENDGKVSLAEVARRAGVYQSTFNSPNHKHTTLPRVKEFIKTALPNKNAKKGRARSKASQEAAKWKEKFNAVNEMLDLAVRERNLQEVQLVKANDEIKELKQLLRLAKRAVPLKGKK